jgi:peroxiredoxin
MTRSRLRLGLAFIAALGCATRSGASGGEPRQSLDLTLPDVHGNMVTPTAETGEETFVLVFWATWCQPCQQELTAMNRLYEAQKARGLRVYAISIDGPDTAAQVVPWVEREGYRFEVLLDRETEVLTRYNPRGDIPYYVVLAADGKILKDHQGYMSGDIEELTAFLETVLPGG